jgi:hypothetical protein
MPDPKFIFGAAMAVIYWSVGVMLLITGQSFFGIEGPLESAFAVCIIIYGFVRLYKAVRLVKRKRMNWRDENE